jgi:putative glutamine amidotransferase
VLELAAVCPKGYEPSMRPIIGVTMSFQEPASGAGSEHFALYRKYVAAVERAGGVAVGLPAQPDAVADLLPILDGLLLSGGGDVDPDLFGQDRHPKTRQIDRQRDDFELALVREWVRADRPLLAICRGIQVLNVALGGSLIQDIADQVAHPLIHQRAEGEARHPIRVQPNSRLASLLGDDRLEVNSYHHQAVQDLAPALEAVAWAADGITEGVEMPSARFVIGVQWHPELMFASDARQLQLFVGLVQASESWRKGQALSALEPHHVGGLRGLGAVVRMA